MTGRRLWLLIAVLLAGMTACAPKPARREQSRPFLPSEQTARTDSPPLLPFKPLDATGGTPPAPAEETLTLARSVEGRPITLHILGRGDQSVLILAGFHGDESVGTEVAESLLAHLRANPALCDGRRIAIAPAVNPDGLLRHERTNANHVDINRNFAASNWSQLRGTRYSRGRVPGSEPETQAVMVAVQLTEPARILSIHSIDRNRQCNNYDGPAAALAYAMSAANKYPARPTMGYETPGSFGTWAGIDRHIPTITLELPRSLTGQQCWADNREAILTFLAGG